MTPRCRSKCNWELSRGAQPSESLAAHVRPAAQTNTTFSKAAAFIYTHCNSVREPGDVAAALLYTPSKSATIAELTQLAARLSRPARPQMYMQ